MTNRSSASTALARRGEGAITRFSPWTVMENLRREMDELISRAFGYTPLSRLISEEPVRFEPAVDIYETENELVALAALPGITPDQVHVEATADTLHIRGERKPFFVDEKATLHYQGWVNASGEFSVQYTLPVEIDPNKVKATFSNGILEIRMPKAEYARPKGVKIEVAKK
ncbi:MAG TPA: Hsp20/alpha crystallin family protein [Chthonomonadales bacterium]|nr:Hsp20/alpha crystallin family protein [Chthonomonadales bacterium]